MKNILSDLAYDITQLIKGSGRVILMYDEDGNRTYDQRAASKIFAYPDKMMIMITDDGIDSTVDVALSDSTDVIELQDFINTLRHLTTNYNVLFNIQKYGKEIEPKDFANYGPTDISECLDYYNLERVDELFRGDSDVEIRPSEHNGYIFTINGKTYSVILPRNEIIFFQTVNGSMVFKPTYDNKDQFLVLNTVIKCVQELFKNSDKPFIYFSGSKTNGLGKVYSKIFNKIKNFSKEYGYQPFFTETMTYTERHDVWDDEISYHWYFINPNTETGSLAIDAAKKQNLPFVSKLEESRIDELFKSDSNAEVTQSGDDRYNFTIDGTTYVVEKYGSEIIFSAKHNGNTVTKPIKNNKNQFLVLNTVVSIVKKIINNNPKEILYFSGDRSNGLSKVYSAMAKVLKNDLPDNVALLIPEPKVLYSFYAMSWRTLPFNSTPQYYYIVPDTDEGLDMIDSYKEFLSGNVNEASLSDYKHIKNNDWGLPDNLIKWLENKGFSKIGEGSYSYIFSSDTEDFVVKVNNGKHMDKGYLEYIKFCHEHRGNPHLPKIGQVKKYDDWYIVFIEKLEDFEELGGYSKLKIVVDIKDEADGWKTSITGDIVKQVKDCGKLLKQIKYLGDDDFHVDNLMKRGDTLVITDPLI